MRYINKLSFCFSGKDGHDQKPHGHKRNHDSKRHHHNAKQNGEKHELPLQLQQPLNHRILTNEHHIISGVEFPSLKSDEGKN